MAEDDKNITFTNEQEEQWWRRIYMVVVQCPSVLSPGTNASHADGFASHVADRAVESFRKRLPED
jgi:hypothetical protein